MKKSERQRIAKEARNAAGRIAKGEQEFCCLALKRESIQSLTMFQDLFVRDARKIPEHNHDAWFSEENERSSAASAELRGRRVLGLLFFAHLVEAGELP